MKKIKSMQKTLNMYKLTPIIAVSFLIIAFTEWTHTSVNTDSQWIISIRNLSLQDGVDKHEAREFLETEYLGLFEQVPGMNAMIGTPDRGSQKGDFVLIYILDSKWTRDFHFPQEAQPDQFSEHIQEAIKKPEFTQLLDIYFIEEGYYDYQEYLMFARAK